MTTRKTIIVLCLTFILCMGLTTRSYGSSAITVYLDSKQLTFSDTQPFLDASNRTQVPIRMISEELGATVTWTQSTQIVKIVKKVDGVTTTLSMKIGGKTMTKNGKLVTMDTAPILVNGRTMVPLRFVSENLGVAVEWIAAENKVIIRTGLDPGNIITAVKPSDQWVVDLARDNSAIGDLYLVDSVKTVDYLTGLKAILKDPSGSNETGIHTGTNMDNGGFVGVNTVEPEGDIVIHQFNGRTLSFDATWVALSTLFGKADATKVWMQMDGLWKKVQNGTITDAEFDGSPGSITGYTYIIKMTYPSGIDFYFNKK